MISSAYTDDPAMPPVIVIACDEQDYLFVWNSSFPEGPETRTFLLNEALRIAQQPPTGGGEVIDFAEILRARLGRRDTPDTSTGTGQ